MIIKLKKAKEITLVEKKIQTLQELTIDRIVDNPRQKFVRCFITEIIEPVVLWEGAAYDAIGQWSDTDVETRLQEIYK